MIDNKKSLQSCNGLDTILSDDLTLHQLKEMKGTSPAYLSPPLPSINQMEADQNQREKMIKEQVIFKLQQKSNLHSRYGSLNQSVISKETAQNKLPAIKDSAFFPSPSHNFTQAINSNQGEEDQTFTENSVRKLLKHQPISSSSSTYLKKGKQPMSFQLFIKLMKAQRQFKSFLIQRQIPLKALKYIKDIASNENAGTSSMLFSSQKSKLLSTFSNQTNKLGELNRAIRLHSNRLKEYLLGLFDRYLPVLNPLSQFRICFDVILILTVVSALFFNTIEVFFDLRFNEMYSDFYPIIKQVWILVFFLNIFLNLNTGIYQKGNITVSHEAVWTYYFNNRLLTDILSIFSLINFPHHYTSILIIFKLFILFKIPLVVSKLNFAMQATQTVQSSSQIYNLVRLIKLILTILCVAHFMAISFYGQILIDDTNQQNWVQACKVLDMSDSWAKKYVFALYFSVTTMVTVGYGDITPVNTQEAVLVIISMVISSGIFAYTFNLIGSIISDMNKKQKIYKKKLHMMNIYLLNHNVDPDLCYQVQNFLEYKFQSDQQLSKEEEENVLSDLSPNLQESVNFEVKKNIFAKGQNIFSIFSAKMKNLLCLEMKEIRANKGEIIFEQGDLEEDPKMYFIHRGSVDILFSREISNNYEEIILNTLQEGMYFGEVSFLIDQPRLSSAKVKESSIIYSLSRSDFLRVIATDKADQEKFFMISSKITFNKSLSVINGQCYYCQKESHTVNTCPFLHYSPAQDLIILKEKYSVPTLERQFQVRLGKKSNSLLYFSDNKEIVMKLRKKNKKKSRLISQPTGQANPLNEEELSISRKTTNHKSMTNSLHLQTFQKIQEQYSQQGEGDEDVFEQLFSDHSSYSSSQQNEDSEISIPSLNQSDKRMNSFCADNKNHGTRVQSVESIPEESCIVLQEQKKVKPNQLQSNINANDPLQVQQHNIKLKVKKQDNMFNYKSEQTENEKDQQENLFDKDQGELQEKGGEIPPSFLIHKNNLFSEPKIQLVSDPGSAISTHAILLSKQNTPKQHQANYGDTLITTKTHTHFRAPSRQRVPSTSFQLPEDTPQRYKSSQKLKGFQFTKQHHTVQSNIQEQQQSQQQLQQSAHIIKSQNILKENVLVKRKNSLLQISNVGSKSKEINRLNEKPLLHKSEVVINTNVNEDILSGFDEMHEFEFYYPHYNFKNIISNYNRLRNFQNIKLPPYFGVYSFVNRKDRKLKYRLQTLGIKRIRQYDEQQQLEKQNPKKKIS